MTRLIRLGSPESFATVTNLAPVLPLMTETDSEFQSLCLNEPAERFINFASFDTGVLAFECIFNSLISNAAYSLRAIFLFAAFLATSIANLIRSGLISRSQSSSSSELMRTDDHDHPILLRDREPALHGNSLCSGLVYTLSRAFFLLDQRLADLKFEHGSRVSLCRESVLIRGNMNQIHATT
jgi:hypothetical protein